MKIVIAPDSFKGSLSAVEVSQAMAIGARRVFPNGILELVPMADGGEGTVQTLVESTGGIMIPARVTGPLGDPVDAFFGIMGDGHTAIIEMASASGLPLVPLEKRDPRITTTFGTGELIKAALEKGCRKIIIGIGGSATNDGGAGMAQALGIHFLDNTGAELQRGGLALRNLERIDISGKYKLLNEAQVIVACDVTNPLTGSLGAAAVYGPQKGATEEMVLQLDQALKRFSKVIERDFQISVDNLPGAGAAGGLGAGLAVFLNGKLKPGVEIITEVVKLEDKLLDAQLVITGEGRMDSQTIHGKTPIGVARTAKKFKLPVLAVAGSLGPGVAMVYEHGIDGISACLDRPLSLEEAINHAAELVADATERMLRTYLAGRQYGLGNLHRNI